MVEALQRSVINPISDKANQQYIYYIIFSLSLSLSLWFYSQLDPGRFFSFLILYTLGRTPWTGDQSVARPLPTHRIKAHRHPCLDWDSNPRSQCSFLKPRSHCDRLTPYSGINYTPFYFVKYKPYWSYENYK